VIVSVLECRIGVQKWMIHHFYVDKEPKVYIHFKNEQPIGSQLEMKDGL
jgi:hypothetical protein